MIIRSLILTCLLLFIICWGVRAASDLINPTTRTDLPPTAPIRRYAHISIPRLEIPPTLSPSARPHEPTQDPVARRLIYPDMPRIGSLAISDIEIVESHESVGTVAELASIENPKMLLSAKIEEAIFSTKAS